jgi:hypothetical protein
MQDPERQGVAERRERHPVEHLFVLQEPTESGHRDPLDALRLGSVLGLPDVARPSATKMEKTWSQRPLMG